MNHTPGPWAFHDCALVQDTGNRLHLGVFHEAPGLGRAAAGNARLIAAAPQLLAALRDALACIDEIPEGDRARLGLYSMHWYGQAREALAQAEGQQ